MKEFLPTNASFLLSEDCNMACKYCFELGSHKNIKISTLVLDKALNYLFNNAIRRDAIYGINNGVGITLFGGEPMLHQKAVLYSIEKGIDLSNYTEIPFYASIVTNGTLINDEFVEKLKFIVNCGASVSFQISIDGIGEKNDEERIFKNGKGSFETIEKNLILFKRIFEELEEKHHNRISIHGSLTRRTLPHLFETYEYIIDKWDIPRTWFMPIQSEKWEEEDVKIYEEQLYKIFTKMKEKYKEDKNEQVFYDYGTFERSKEIINGNPKPCGAGDTYCTITGTGKINVCHQFYFQEGGKNFDLGTVFKPNEIDVWKTKLFMDYDGRDLYCEIDRECNLASVCYRCIADNYNQTGSVLSTKFNSRCEMTKLEYEYGEKIKRFIKEESRC